MQNLLYRYLKRYRWWFCGCPFPYVKRRRIDIYYSRRVRRLHVLRPTWRN